MSEQDFDREKWYQAAMQIADALLKKGAVSEEEYHQIKTKLLDKYRPTLSTLLSGKPLI
nr:MAG TPA: Gas vesicle protein G [Caudoviricetes sp.]